MVTEPRNSSRPTAGFTLLELLVVLAIAGLLISLIPPVISAAVPGARLKLETLDLAQALRASRNEAVNRGTQIDVVIDAEAQRYEVGGSTSVLPDGIVVRILEDRYFDARISPASARRLPSDPYTLRFYPDGGASGATIRLSQDRAAYLIDVDWMIGRVSISKDSDNDY